MLKHEQKLPKNLKNQSLYLLKDLPVVALQHREKFELQQSSQDLPQHQEQERHRLERILSLKKTPQPTPLLEQTHQDLYNLSPLDKQSLRLLRRQPVRLLQTLQPLLTHLPLPNQPLRNK